MEALVIGGIKNLLKLLSDINFIYRCGMAKKNKAKKISKLKASKNMILVVSILLVIIAIALMVAYQTNYPFFKKLIIGINDVLRDKLFIGLFYIAVLFVFREQLNFESPTAVSFIKVSLIIVSAYFSYEAFINLGTPYFISLIGGIAFALSIQQITALIFASFTNKLSYKLPKGLIFVLFSCLVIAMLLDMSMTMVKLVLGEGKYVIFQESLEKRENMEKSRALVEKAKLAQKQLDYLENLTLRGQYGNARFHSEKFFADTTDNKLVLSSTKDEMILGPIQKGLTNITGSERKGKVLTLVFIFLISFCLTSMIMGMEIKEQYSSVRKVVPASVTKGNSSIVEKDTQKNGKVYHVTPPAQVTPQVTGDNNGDTQFGFQVSNSSNKKKPSKLQRDIIEVYETLKKENQLENLNISKLAKLTDRSRKFVYKTLYSYTDFSARQ